MTALTDHMARDSSLSRGFHRYAPWLALAVVVLLVLSYYTAYRRSEALWEAEQNKPLPSVAASATAAPKKPASGTTKPASTSAKLSKVLVVSAVTLRKDPSSSSAPIRDLAKGDSLTLVGQVGSWYKVTDAKGVIGWVTASQKYTKVVNE